MIQVLMGHNKLETTARYSQVASALDDRTVYRDRAFLEKVQKVDLSRNASAPSFVPELVVDAA